MLAGGFQRIRAVGRDQDPQILPQVPATSSKFTGGSSTTVRAQLRNADRPPCRQAFSRVADLGIRYLPYGELKAHCAAIERFGAGPSP